MLANAVGYRIERWNSAGPGAKRCVWLQHGGDSLAMQELLDGARAPITKEVMSYFLAAPKRKMHMSSFPLWPGV